MKTLAAKLLLFGFAVTAFTLSLSAEVLFSDNFDTSASELWSNGRGNWSAADGAYNAANPANIPPTFSGLPFVLRNFTVDVDINRVADGGIWLRCDPAGTNGVLLVTGGHGWGGGNRGGNAGRSLYWHVITPQNYNSPAILNEAVNVFPNPGQQNVHLRVEVVGNSYAAYVNGSTTPATTLVETDLIYSSGGVGLYDYSEQTFDNFVLQVPSDGPYALGIARAGPAQVKLFWPTAALGWELEWNSTLAPADWKKVDAVPAINGTHFELTVTPEVVGPFFFRLHRP